MNVPRKYLSGDASDIWWTISSCSSKCQKRQNLHLKFRQICQITEPEIEIENQNIQAFLAGLNFSLSNTHTNLRITSTGTQEALSFLKVKGQNL